MIKKIDSAVELRESSSISSRFFQIFANFQVKLVLPRSVEKVKHILEPTQKLARSFLLTVLNSHQILNQFHRIESNEHQYYPLTVVEVLISAKRHVHCLQQTKRIISSNLITNKF